MLPVPGSYENRRGALHRLNADREDLFREELATASTFLTAKERQAYDAVPDEFSHQEVVKYFTLTPDDLAEVKKGRGRTLKLGFALRLSQLRWLGHFPDNVKGAPTLALQFLSELLGLPPEALAEYPDQGPTRWIHMERIRKHLGYREFNNASALAEGWLLSLALEHDFTRGLLDRLIEHLRREKIVRPGISNLERLITRVRDQANAQVLDIYNRQLTEDLRRALDALLRVPDRRTITPLQWLKSPPPHAKAKNLLE